ncbi:hypothetical protein BDB00DRAFT_831523 [Zychaea mexicana]|uniref:uncharacterized protein n=1 Tax=Zychaea mexicana TaxID=64656 RepID=UPI0022FE996A|nr:uncharacterized protein BDB00DRAFT_831523 [Zychaea mexicana]KAI9491815.1 hypothetical protein BDB00DRAFT_831523 [Zychaea mexicana]
MAPVDIPLTNYMFARNDRFRPWWISDRKNVLIYTFYNHVTSDKEACQLLRRNFSGETSMIIRTLSTENYYASLSLPSPPQTTTTTVECQPTKEEEDIDDEKNWVVLEVLIQPERSYMLALKRGLKIERDKEATVVPAIPRSAAGAYMIMRLSGLPMHGEDKEDQDIICANNVRKSIGSLFLYWQHDNKPIRVLEVFPERIEEEDAVRWKGSVVVILDGDYYIPQQNLESGLAYVAAYDQHVKFQVIGPFHYNAFCPTHRIIDSHTPENCKYFENEYPGGLSFF